MAPAIQARLGTKLLLARLPIGASLLIVGYLAVQTIDTLGRGSQAILQDNYRSVLSTERMRGALDGLEVVVEGVVLGDKDVDDKMLRAVTSSSETFESALVVQESNITEPGEKELTRSVRERWQQIKGSTQAIIHTQQTEKAARHTIVSARYQDDFVPQLSRLKEAIEGVLTVNQDAMVQKSDRARHMAVERRTIMLAVLLAAVVLGLYASVSLTRRTIQPLSILTMAAKRLGAGDFSARAQIQAEDEIGALAAEFNTMAGHLRDYRSSSLGELLTAQQSAQAAIDSLLDPVLVFGADGRLSGFNEAAETTLKLNATQSAPLASVEPSIRDAIEHVVEHVLSGKGPLAPKSFDEAVPFHGGDGERFLLPRATPIYEQGGAVSGATLVLQDVTRLRRFDELKSDLVATVAHEFRTPLTSLRMAVHLCLEQLAGPITERQADLLDAAKHDCQRLQILVDDLLELSRIESGTIEPHVAVMSVAILAQEAIARHEQLAGEQQVRLVSQVSPFLPMAQADVDRVPVIFDNLIANAIRHSPQGSEVVVDAQVDGSLLRVTVHDQGPGVAPEYREKIFEKFFRVPGSASGSAGLGLYISRQIARSNGGDVTVASEVGKGSAFSFTLPRTQAPDPPHGREGSRAR